MKMHLSVVDSGPWCKPETINHQIIQYMYLITMLIVVTKFFNNPTNM